MSEVIRFASSLEWDQGFNLLEGLLWLSISLIFLIRLPKLTKNRDLAILSVIAFALFGLSDLIEIRTRAWYRPISLLVLKAVCLLTLVSVLVVYQRRKVRSGGKPGSLPREDSERRR